jgi:hypothetical protein
MLTVLSFPDDAIDELQDGQQKQLLRYGRLPARIELDIIDCIMFYCIGLGDVYDIRGSDENENTHHTGSTSTDALIKPVRTDSRPSMHRLGYMDSLPL